VLQPGELAHPLTTPEGRYSTTSLGPTELVHFTTTNRLNHSPFIFIFVHVSLVCVLCFPHLYCFCLTYKKFFYPLVKPLPLGGASKSSVAEDIANQITAHFELLEKFEKKHKQEQKKTEKKRKEISKPGEPSFARLNFDEEALAKAYEALKNSLTVEEAMEAQANVTREYQSGNTRPLLYLRNTINNMNQGFLILFDKKKGQYLIYLNLHSIKSRFAKEIKLGGLQDIRSKTILPENKINKTGALFPIKFAADYQLEEFMQKAKSASAKLLERHGRFEVHVTFEFEAKKIATKTLLGVDRGIYNLASLCVVDEIGHIIEESNPNDRSGWELRALQQREERRQRKTQKKGKKYKSSTRKTEANKAVHAAANKIVAMAEKHKSQVVLENLDNLTNRGGKRGRSNFNRLLTRAQYTKLKNALEYKLPCAGLPQAVTVAAQGTSQTCPECGNWDAKNRPKIPLPNKKGFTMDKFECIACGYRHDADLNAARIIALKKQWRLGQPKSQQKKFAKALVGTEYAFESCLKLWAKKRNM